ncbi:MAG: hypothetical protein HQK53_02700 [Oligoflexia bacterium]|nr:hypothetical protein [Oligoflexia bacterium]
MQTKTQTNASVNASCKLAYLLLVSALFVSALCSFTANARDFYIDRSGDFTSNKDVIKSILLDYPSYGQKPQHKYHLSGIDEMRIVKKVDENHFYTWTYVHDSRTYKYFNYVTIKEGEDGKIVVRSTFPNSDSVATLQRETGLPHFAFFDYTNVSWTISDKKDAQGNVIGTHVRYVGNFSASGFAATLGARIINSNLQSTATEMFAVLGEQI